MIVAVGLLAGPDALLRWAAATALARLAPEHPPEAAVQELLGWLTDPPESNSFALQANPDAFPCHNDMPFGEYTLQTLVRPGLAARQRVTEALLARLEGASGWRAEGLLWELMVVAFAGDPQAPRPPFAGLDPLQQRIVGALAGMPWIWQAPPGERIPADNPLWAYGLPNTQQGLKLMSVTHGRSSPTRQHLSAGQQAISFQGTTHRERNGVLGSARDFASFDGLRQNALLRP
jgi:hypothetical protein